MSVLNFAELLPERITINNLPDGSSLTLMRREEMDVADIAALEAIQAKGSDLEGQMKRAKTDTARMNIVTKMNDIQAEFIRLLSPDVADETISSLKLGQRTLIIRHWGEQNRPAQAEAGNG